MKKTALEWFNTIENLEARESAISNTKRLDKRFNSLQGALLESFIWQKTKEGYKFWSEIHTPDPYIRLKDLQKGREQLNAEYLQAQDETHRDVIAEAVVEVDRKIKELKNQLQ